MPVNQEKTNSVWSGDDDMLVVVGHVVCDEGGISEEKDWATAAVENAKGSLKTPVDDDSELMPLQFYTWKDTWAAVLFLVIMGADLVWCVSVLYSSTQPVAFKREIDSLDVFFTDKVDTKNLLLFAVAIPCSAIAIWTGITLLQLAARELIIFNLLLICATTFSLAAFAFLMDFACVGGLIALGGVAQLIFFFYIRGCIFLCAHLLSTAVHVIKQHLTLFLPAGFYSVLFFGYLILNVVATLHTTERILHGEDVLFASGVMVCVAPFITLLTASVIKQMISVMTGGVVATWYISGGRGMPRDHVWTSFKRASTTSLGSACIGALVNLFGAVFRLLFRTGHDFIDFTLLFFCHTLENTLYFFNSYASVHSGMYGCSYVDSLQHTSRFFAECTPVVFFNDLLAMLTLHSLTVMMTWVISLLCFFMSSLTFNIFVFLLSLTTLDFSLVIVLAALRAIVVCYWDNPNVLEASFPELHATLKACECDNWRLSPPTEKDVVV